MEVTRNLTAGEGMTVYQVLTELKAIPKMGFFEFNRRRTTEEKFRTNVYRLVHTEQFSNTVKTMNGEE